MTPQQKRVITSVCRNLVGLPDSAGRILEVHRTYSGRLAGCSREEIANYAADHTGIDARAVLTGMAHKD